MKTITRFAIAGALLVIALGSGAYNHRQLAHLRDARVKLVARAAEKGISLDPENPSEISLPSKLPRVDRVGEAKQVSAGFIAYAGEMEGIEGNRDPFDLDETVRQRIIAQTDRVASLDAGQLKILIGEFHADQGDSDRHRYLIGFALHRLMKDHPREMLAMLIDTPGLFESMQGKGSRAQSLMGNALCRLAEHDLTAARQWLDEHRETLSATAFNEVMQRLIGMAAARDLRLALDMMDESGMATPHFLSSMLRQVRTEERGLALSLLRERIAAGPDAGALGMISIFEDTLKAFAFGSDEGLNFERRSFEESSAWIDQAGLSPAELEMVTNNLQNDIQMKELGSWIEWLGRKLPDDIARNRVSSMFLLWIDADYKAAGTWLETAEEGSLKDSMVDTYVAKVFPVEKEKAIRLVVALPEGRKREDALNKLYRRWPKQDEVSAAEAEAFAEKHGIRR